MQLTGDTPALYLACPLSEKSVADGRQAMGVAREMQFVERRTRGYVLCTDPELGYSVVGALDGTV